MNDLERRNENDDAAEQSSGPSLTLLYSLLALALALAIGFALLIILPFYHRHSF